MNKFTLHRFNNAPQEVKKKIYKGLMDRPHLVCRCTCGNAIIKVHYFSRTNIKDIPIIAYLNNIYAFEDLKGKGFSLPRDEKGRVIWSPCNMD